MEKVILTLWAQSDGDGLRNALLEDAVPRVLASAGVHSLRLAVSDSAVKPAADKRMSSTGELPVAVVSVWLDQAAQVEAVVGLLAANVDAIHAYLVTEAEPIVNTQYPADASGRVAGFCQVVFLRIPQRLSREEWLSVWLGSHTSVAIETQSTFAYRQNVVARSLSPDAPAIDAIVEECFPLAAMSSALAFYDAADEAEMQARLTTMMESTARFIDFHEIDVIPMSEYLFKA